MEEIIILVGLTPFILLGLYRIYKAHKLIMRKARAAVIIENLLEIQKVKRLYLKDPKNEATNIIEEAWELKSDIMNDKFDFIPHDVSVACISIALRLKDYDYAKDKDFEALINCLVIILDEVNVNGAFYKYSSMDYSLFEESLKILKSKSEEMLLHVESEFKELYR